MFPLRNLTKPDYFHPLGARNLETYPKASICNYLMINNTTHNPKLTVDVKFRVETSLSSRQTPKHTLHNKDVQAEAGK